jgi:glycosyltransferase involved in cell wall biosynthesis
VSDERDELRAALGARFPRVAIVHEWLTIPGGSEKVVLALLDLFPQAELFTSVYDPAPWPEAITGRRVHASWLSRIPGATTHYPRLLPLMNLAFRSFDLRGFDLVISSNHASAKNVRVPDGVPHVCYCHTPMRYAWDLSFLEGEDIGRLERTLAPLVARRLRHVDRRAAAGPTVFVANSHHVAERIATYYGRDAVVVHPPVETERFLDVRRAPTDRYLSLGRLVPYKRPADAVAACRRLGRPLWVAGSGRGLPEAQRAAAADPRIAFLGFVEDERIPELLGEARALLFPGVEDFGIVPVEAQAAGLPVIALNEGGVRDSVIDGVTGILYDGAGPDALAAAIERFEATTFDDAALRDHARGFGPEVFARRFAEVVLAL